MKKLMYVSCVLSITLLITSCNVDDFLNVPPKDFLTTENSYKTQKDIKIAVNHLYAQLREDFFDYWGPDTGVWRWYATDMAVDAIAVQHRYNLYSKLVPSSEPARWYWMRNYELIKNTNIIINRIENVKFQSESLRKKLIAQTKFFRAWAYRYLSILYGDVPLVLKELKGPKRDFKRTPREKVLAQAIEDAKYAIKYLPAITEREADGRLSKAAARQLLTQIYMATEDYKKAIKQATTIIQSPHFKLMTHRFGSQANKPGNVYSDLFKRGNQNRSIGNMESIWVSQYEYQTPGGTPGPFNGNPLPWILIPKYYTMVGPDEKPLFTSALSRYGGEGQGWMSSTAYMDSLIWKRSGWNSDMRNSNYLILHDIKANNPESVWHGQYIIKSGALKYNANPLGRTWHAIWLKVSADGNFPQKYITNPETGAVTGTDVTFRDTYIYRLAQTYLLRAEAYLMTGKKALAAKDINAIRKRANAKPISPAEVDLNYILDERARELAWEGTSFRRLVLMRMNKLVPRVRKYNPISGPSIKDYNKLLPIPVQAIIRNTGHKLRQNPGY